MHGDEDHEDRHQGEHRLLHPAKVEQDQDDDADQRDINLEWLPGRTEKAEQRIRTA